MHILIMQIQSTEQIFKKNIFNNNVSNIEDRLWAKKINKDGKLLAYTARLTRISCRWNSSTQIRF